VVNPSLPVQSVKELIALAKAKPGELSYATSGPGGTGHMATELFNRQVGITMLHVPYKGNSQALVDVIGGQVPLMFDQISTSDAYIRSGKLRALALAGKRNPAYPDLPALSEFYPGVELTPWLGLLAPSGLPAPVLERVRKETARMLADPATRERIQSISLDPFVTTPQEFAAFVRSEYKKYGELVRIARVTID